MPSKILRANGDFTGSLNWYESCTATGAEQITSSAVVGVSTTNITSGNIIGNNEVVLGTMLKVSSLNAAPSTNRFIVELFNATDNNVPVSMSCDIANMGSYGWQYFQFFTSSILTTGKTFNIRARTTMSTGVTLFRDATTNNISRVLVKNTTNVPTTLDNVFIAGATLNGTNNITPYTASISSDLKSTPYRLFNTGRSGMLNFVTNKNTRVTVQGVFEIGDKSVVNVGRISSSIQSSVSASIEFPSRSSVQFGMEVYGSLSAVGADFTNNRYKTTLTSSANAGQSILRCSDNVQAAGWKVGDELVLPPTRRTFSERDRGFINTISASVITLRSNLSFTHDSVKTGSIEIACPVANLTRNVKIYPTGSFSSYFFTAPSSRVTLRNVEFRLIGANVTNRQGIYAGTSTGIFDMRYCSVRDNVSHGLVFSSTSGTGNNFTAIDNIIIGGSVNAFSTTAMTGTWNFSNNLCIATSNAPNCNLADVNGTFDNNYIAGGQSGVNLTEGGFPGNIVYNNNVISSCTLTGLYIFSAGSPSTVNFSEFTSSATFNNFKIFRNATGAGTNANSARPTLINYCQFFGNTNGDIQANTRAPTIYKNCIFDPGPTPITQLSTVGVRLTTDEDGSNVMFDNCTFGLNTDYSVGDFQIVNGTQPNFNILTHNCLFNADFTKVIVNQNQMVIENMLRSSNYNQVSGYNITFQRGGEVIGNLTGSRSGGRCIELMPIAADFTVKYSVVVPVKANTSRTITFYARRSSNYNGSNPIVFAYGNYKNNLIAININGGTSFAGPRPYTVTTSYVKQTVVIPATSILTDGAVELFFACNGTVGSVFIDDINYTNFDTFNFDYWYNALPPTTLNNANGTKALGFFG